MQEREQFKLSPALQTIWSEWVKDWVYEYAIELLTQFQHASEF